MPCRLFDDFMHLQGRALCVVLINSIDPEVSPHFWIKDMNETNVVLIELEVDMQCFAVTLPKRLKFFVVVVKGMDFYTVMKHSPIRWLPQNYVQLCWLGRVFQNRTFFTFLPLR